jgi:hypothetical protein
MIWPEMWLNGSLIGMTLIIIRRGFFEIQKALIRESTGATGEVPGMILQLIYGHPNGLLRHPINPV